MHDSPLEPLLKATAKTLFDGSVVVAAEIDKHLPNTSGKDRLANERAWTTQTELLWYLLAVLFRYIPIVPGPTRADRDAIQDDLVSEVINHMLDRMYDWERESSATRPQTTQALLDWYNEAEMDYGMIVQVEMSAEQFAEMVVTEEIPQDSLVGRFAQRVISRMGGHGNADLAPLLINKALMLHNATNLPRIAAVLVKARHAT